MVKQPAHVGAAMLALALVSFGCDMSELSDENQYRLDIGLQKPLGSHGHHVLVGSSFRLQVVGVLEGEVDEENGGGLGCATRSGSGVVVELDDGEFMVEAVGNGAVELADPGISCPANEDILAQLGPDRWSVIGVAPADVVGRWAYTYDGYIADFKFSPGPRAVFPDVIGRPIDELRVAADFPFSAAPALVRTTGSGDEVEVRFGHDDHELVLPEHHDIRPRIDGVVERQTLEGTLDRGVAFEASLTVAGNSFQLPPVQAVPVESIASLELVPVYREGDAEREWGSPVGVLAIARDGDGQRVIGAPVEFELERGHLAFYPESDTVQVDDVCRPAPAAPTARFATIVGKLGQLEASVDLEWIDLPRDDEYDPPPECVQSCAITDATPGESAPGLLALFGLGVWLRRRSRNGQ